MCKNVSTTRLVNTSDVDYESGCVVPAGDWRNLTVDLAQRLVGETDERRMVEIVRLPEDLFTAVVEARHAKRAEVPVLPGTDAEYRGSNGSYADELTTTINPETSLRIGLHLDNWDQKPCATRLEARRRLMVNLGPAPRYLLLGDIDGVAICQGLYPEDWAARVPHTSDVAAYAVVNPMACLRIRIDPGEGYVAPTDLLVHDGSTTGLSRGPQIASTAAFWLGHIPQGILPPAL